MVSISVSELKARLSQLLRRVKAGETVVVTDRGRPVAQLTPPPREGIEDLVAGRVIRPGRGEVSPRFWDLPLPGDPDGKVLDSLLRERGEGR